MGQETEIPTECVQCGTDLRHGITFCVACGFENNTGLQQLDMDQFRERDAAENNKRDRRHNLITVVAAGIVLLIGTMSYAINPKLGLLVGPTISSITVLVAYVCVTRAAYSNDAMQGFLCLVLWPYWLIYALMERRDCGQPVVLLGCATMVIGLLTMGHSVKSTAQSTFFAVYDSDNDYFVFTRSDPRKAGYEGIVLEAISLDLPTDERTLAHLFEALDADRSQICLGQSRSELTQFRIFANSMECQRAMFKILGSRFSIHDSWPQYEEIVRSTTTTDDKAADHNEIVSVENENVSSPKK